jgi:hypothetical protein
MYLGMYATAVHRDRGYGSGRVWMFLRDQVGENGETITNGDVWRRPMRKTGGRTLWIISLIPPQA